MVKINNLREFLEIMTKSGFLFSFHKNLAVSIAYRPAGGDYWSCLREIRPLLQLIGRLGRGSELLLVSFHRNSALTAALRAAGGRLVSFHGNLALITAFLAAEGLLVSFHRNSALTAAL